MRSAEWSCCRVSRDASSIDRSGRRLAACGSPSQSVPCAVLVRALCRLPVAYLAREAHLN
eukprot:scaffold12797_cov129-Isochrysis_galbana.AAC.3